jgi:nucleoside 2-deoxyribosyltransferase
MAVGRGDTDQIYDKHILPTLRRMQITAVFMGRLEHNDDIDKRIIREIEASDFVIADLTYARPSVYFEAGYAQRQVPVVYTCRTDHIGQGSSEWRVHFDLLMRNIVRWSNPKDRTFASRLGRRVKLVIRPIAQHRQSNAKAKADMEQFQSLSLVNRIDSIAEIFGKTLRSCGYRPLTEKKNPCVGRFRKRTALNLSVVCAEAEFTQRNISDHVNDMSQLIKFLYSEHQWDFRWGHLKEPKTIETNYVKRIAIRLVLCSLHKIPTQRLVSALPTSIASAGGQVYSLSQVFPVDPNKVLPGSIFVHVVAPVLSESDAEMKSRELRRIIKQSPAGGSVGA